MRFQKIAVACTFLGLLTAFAGSVSAVDSSIDFTKTVGLDPNECATTSILPAPPPDGVVFYCYKMTYTGTISASSHTLIDSVLGSVLNNIPGHRCCIDASATNCEEPLQKCNPQPNAGGCSDPTYPVCANTTYPGVCCDDKEGISCGIPHDGCIEDADCDGGDYCVTNPLVANGQTVTRVITATVPPQGITNHATWTAQAGICCGVDDFDCKGDNPAPCADDDDCGGAETCTKSGIGICCDPNNPSDCDPGAVCLTALGCDFDDSNHTECVAVDTTAEGESTARVGVFDTPAVSVLGLAILILGLAGIGLFRVNRRQQPIA